MAGPEWRYHSIPSRLPSYQLGCVSVVWPRERLSKPSTGLRNGTRTTFQAVLRRFGSRCSVGYYGDGGGDWLQQAAR